MHPSLIVAHVSRGKTRLPGDWVRVKTGCCDRDISELETQALCPENKQQQPREDQAAGLCFFMMPGRRYQDQGRMMAGEKSVIRLGSAPSIPQSGWGLLTVQVQGQRTLLAAT